MKDEKLREVARKLYVIAATGKRDRHVTSVLKQAQELGLDAREKKKTTKVKGNAEVVQSSEQSQQEAEGGA
jgi:ribosome assembly protein YihI (activator of Der GTPase)